MKRIWVVVLVVLVGSAAGALGVVLAHKGDKQLVEQACHAAVLKASKGSFSNEQVATPAKGQYVMTGEIAGSQFTCQATVTKGVVKVQNAILQ